LSQPGSCKAQKKITNFFDGPEIQKPSTQKVSAETTEFVSMNGKLLPIYTIVSVDTEK
jgi:hypothetical protein